ncbi:MAG: hypothetical protein WCI11_05885 [Candidatus Methylumidiphilus sp.]
MKKDKKDIVRCLYTHNQLLAGAQTFLNQSKLNNEFNNTMGCVLFCAFALEASLNHLGKTLFPFWNEHLKRKLNPEGKLTLIASEINMTVDFGSKPFQAFRAIFEFRNQIAHATTEDLKLDSGKNWLEYGNYCWPVAKWEVLCTSEQASLLLQDTREMIDKLFINSGAEIIPDFLISEHIKREK